MAARLKVVVSFGFRRYVRSDVPTRVIAEKEQIPYIPFRIGKNALFIDNAKRIWYRPLGG